MSIMIELPLAQEKHLQAEATKKGVSVDELVSRTLAEHFPIASDRNAAALRLIDEWLAEVPKDPQEIKEAEDDLLALQKALNQTRKEAGARLHFPEVE